MSGLYFSTPSSAFGTISSISTEHSTKSSAHLQKILRIAFAARSKMTPTAIGRRILFLKTDNYDVSESAPSHRIMFQVLRSKGHTVDERSWLHPDTELGPLTLEDLKTYDVISFLMCYEYNRHIDEFHKFVKDCVIPAQEAGVLVFNDPQLVLWNSNKIYLDELAQDLAITIPDTTFVGTVGADGKVPSFEEMLSQHRTSYRSGNEKPVVIKPSISASSKSTHKIPHPSSSSYDKEEAQKLWSEVYAYARGLSSTTKVMIQSFEPSIKKGEYSIIFINNEYTHTALKTPAQKDFRAGWEFGATTRELELGEVPEEGKEVGRKLVQYVKKKFGIESLGYLRLDGVVRDDGKFVLIEAEMLEPYIYFTEEGEGLKRFCDFITGSL